MRLQANGLTVRYGDRVAVAGASLTAAPGEVLAILGANGSGKSTMLKALAGLLPKQGAVLWDGAIAVPGRVGYMPQDNLIQARLTAFEVVLLGRLRSLTLRVGASDLEAARSAMDELGIAGFESRRINELSGGQRQLVFMAQVLAADPGVLLLDEPTSALDIAHQLHVLTLLRLITARRCLTTIVVLHDLNAAARFADRMVLMQEGRVLCAGPPQDVLCPEMLRAAFGVHVSVQGGPDGCPVVVPLHAIGGDGRDLR
jgi:iron complex transport system ATP-binding protein